MKKAAIIYFGLSLILYLVGLSSFCRKYIEEDYGIRSDTFDPTQRYWTSGDLVYSEGRLNSRSSDHLPKESKLVYQVIDLKSAASPKEFINALPSANTFPLPLVQVNYGSDAQETISTRPADVYAVFAGTSCTNFIVDAKNAVNPKIYNLYWSSPHYRTASAKSSLWLALPLAHALDLTTAPFQAVAVVAISLITPKWN